MKYIEKLLKGAEVKWMPLGEVLRRTKGTKITAGQMKAINKNDAPVKIFAGGKTIAFVDFEDIPEKDINREPSVIVKSRGIIEFEYYDKPFSHKNEMWSYYSENKNISIKYVYYFLKQQEPYFQKVGSKMQMPQIAIPDTEKFLIPIPPLTVQEERVMSLKRSRAGGGGGGGGREAELDCRKRQYEYYRNQLLSLEVINNKGNLNNVEVVTLGEIVTIKNGKTYKHLSTGNIPVYGSGGIMCYVDQYVYDKPTVLIPRKGSLENIFYLDKPFWNVDTIYYTEIKDNIIMPKFLYHYLINKHLENLNLAGGVPSLTQKVLNNVPVPIPPLAEQQRIVSILDKFEALTTSISEGLPKEIELRRKQYEYYRNQLLSFA